MAEPTKKTDNDAPAQREYFFPHAMKVVWASSKEEAESKLADLLKPAPINK